MMNYYKLCEHPVCNKKADKIYHGYFDYRLCQEHYNIFYSFFCKFIIALSNWKCDRCGNIYNLTVHHLKKRSQGGRHTIENCRCLCVDCHKLYDK